MESLIELWHQYRSLIILLSLLSIGVLHVCLYIRTRKRSLSYPVQDPGRSITEKRALSPFLKNSPSPTQAYSPVSTIPEPLVRGPKRILGSRKVKTAPGLSVDPQRLATQPIVFFSSLSGSTESAAQAFTSAFEKSVVDVTSSCTGKLRAPKLLDLSYIDYDDYFTSLPKADEATAYFYIILVPTYNIDSILTNFLEHLQETHHDFRVDTAPLRDVLGYAVFGFGDKAGWPTEEAGFCSQAAEVDKWLAKLTARKRAYPLGMGDVRGDGLERLEEWRLGMQNVLSDLAEGKPLGDGVAGSGDAVESEDEDEVIEVESRGGIRGSIRRKDVSGSLDDVENIGRVLSNGDTSTPLVVDFTTYKPQKLKSTSTMKEMVPQNSPTYAALTKQGYTIVGSHSGVKICRWTKSALRGRGSCYKFSFYGIKSHLCMETTPSLSCSNKCVFCWRHGTNPVGTTWRWKVDPPEEIFAGVKEGHYKKIKMMRGVPGVRAERFEEAMRIKHCALSLVGEPIFYPHINEFTAMLHNERISSFLVCNAQHPDQLATLKPVTQLYVSIDASNKESLRKIDRPLHRDFWERFCRCLDILKEKRFRQRTVFRLTLVKGFNIEDEAEGYADLVERGLPCFVEVKGVTYCGTSSSAGAGLTMQNVPFYEEVTTFVEALNQALERRGLDYGIAAEHAHSCCVLLASKRFYKNERWHTVIDYARFFELLESGEDFAPEDYMAPTLEWALWGNGGFDPADERVHKKGKNKKVEARPNVALEI